jgi:2,4-dienoyl-CoA reductase-like NADH-dependent reductase (Old Yellow Enzyme family)
MTTPGTLQFKRLFSPLKIGSFTVRNRIVSTGHLSHFAVQGLPLERHLDYWVSKAKGGIGLIVTEDQAVHPSGGSEPTVIQSYRDDCIEPFRRIASAVHEHGARIVGQLSHPGSAWLTRRDKGVPLWTVGPIPAFYNVESAHEIDEAEIREIIDCFAAAAVRMQEAGVDGVELMGGHNFLIEQFLSPRSNRRRDGYGGSEENRLRLLLEIVEAVRAAVGDDYTVGLRVSGDQFQGGGYTLDDMRGFAATVSATGKIDYISVTVGTGAPIIPPMYVAPATFVYLAASIKEVVDIPVFCAGRIVDPVQAEDILAKNQADMIGMARANICDPEMPNKAREGRVDEIRHCIGCNEGCWRRSAAILPITCALNPSVGREREMEITPAPSKKRVMVIGGGLAGMEAARVAALRGHSVSLFEKDEEMGGQLLIAAKAPGREDMEEPVRYYQHQFGLLGVDVRLGVDVTPEMVEGESPDVVIVATGGLPTKTSFPGSERPEVVLARDVLAGKAEYGRKLILYSLDRSTEGFTVADFLLEQGCDVEVLIPHPLAPFAGEELTYMMAITRIRGKGGWLTLAYEVASFEDDRVLLSSVFGGPSQQREGIEGIVVSRGSRANDALYKELKGKVGELYAVGQCFAPRGMLESTLDGLRVGRMV